MRLVASYHGISDKTEVDSNWQEVYEWYERSTLPIEKGGMAIRNMAVVALTAFACSLTASLKHMANVFPEWITLGQRSDQMQISHHASPEMSDQVLHYVELYRRQVPQGAFKENDSFPAIIKTIVDIESGDTAATRETQLQGNSQDLCAQPESLLPTRRSTSQGALYSDFIKGELQRLLARSKARADAAFENGYHDDRTRHRNWLSSINGDSGAWLSAGASPKMFEMSNAEFLSAVCRRDTVEDPTIPKYTASMSREDPQIFHCPCDGSSRPRRIDPYGYHLVGCRIGANAIRLHDEVVAMVAKLFRTLRLDAVVEPTRLFNNVDEDASNQRPDIFIRNPRGLGRQVIIDVAVTGVNGQSRTTDEATERPLQTRFDQKMAKYGRVAEQNNLRFIPAVFSHAGQIHGAFKAFVKEQITQKLVAFEGDPKPSKVRSMMRWWSKCISVVIAKTASRNVAFKVAKMREAIMEDQDEFLMRNSEYAGVNADTNDRAHLEDLAQNADLYIANQGVSSQP
jgi:hypothetical protein